jgi:hypothetical protein
MAVQNFLVFLPDIEGSSRVVAGWSDYGLTASILIFVSIYVSALGTHRHIPRMRRLPVRTRFSLAQTSTEIEQNAFRATPSTRLSGRSATPIAF